MRIYHRGGCLKAIISSNKVKHCTYAPIEKLIAQYTANTSGVLPIFNSGYMYEVNEVNNNDGTYTVTIYSDTLPSKAAFGNSDTSSWSGSPYILTVEFLNTSLITDMTGMFRFCGNLTYVNTSNWDTSKVTNMFCMFEGCSSLTTLDMSNWDTSNVTTMSYMFNKCNQLSDIFMYNSNYNSVNRIIEQLPTRTSASPGTLTITGVDDLSKINVSVANTKYWNIEGIQTDFILGKSKLGINKL